MKKQEHDDNLRGTHALIRAGRGLSSDEDDPNPRSGGFFVSGADVLGKLGALEGQALTLSTDIEALTAAGTHPTFKAAWDTWYKTWLKKGEAIRKRGTVSLNLSAGHLMDELDTDQAQLHRWKDTLIAQGGHSSTPAFLDHGQDEPETESRFGALDLKTLIKWAAIITGIFAFGQLFKSFGEAAHGTSNFLSVLKGKPKERDEARGEAGNEEGRRHHPALPPPEPARIAMAAVRAPTSGQGSPPWAPSASSPVSNHHGRDLRHGANNSSSGSRFENRGYDPDHGPVITRPSPLIRPNLKPPDGGWSLVLAPRSELGNVEESLRGKEWFVVDDDPQSDSGNVTDEGYGNDRGRVAGQGGNYR